MVEYTTFLGPTYSSYAYDNIWGPFNTYPGALNEYAPTVAFGGNHNTQYQVVHSSNNSLPGYPLWNTFMEPIGWNDAYNIAWNPGGTARDYFLVNQTPFNPAYNIPNAYNPTAFSTPCNNTADQTMVAWTLYSSLWGYSTVYYKTTGYGGTNGYSFRQWQPAGTSASAITDWNIYPNPAKDLITIYTSVALEAKYEITDMPGRSLLKGNMSGGTQTIDVKSLSPGTYIISLYDGDKRDYSKVFIKQ